MYELCGVCGHRESNPRALVKHLCSKHACPGCDGHGCDIATLNASEGEVLIECETCDGTGFTGHIPEKRGE